MIGCEKLHNIVINTGSFAAGYLERWNYGKPAKSYSGLGCADISFLYSRLYLF
jgi:hypothetical protein